MKQYLERADGSFWLDLPRGAHSVPASGDHRLRKKMLAEIEAGEAEIVPYVAPEPEPEPEPITVEDLIADAETQGDAGIRARLQARADARRK